MIFGGVICVWDLCWLWRFGWIWVNVWVLKIVGGCVGVIVGGSRVWLSLRGMSECCRRWIWWRCWDGLVVIFLFVCFVCWGCLVFFWIWYRGGSVWSGICWVGELGCEVLLFLRSFDYGEMFCLGVEEWGIVLCFVGVYVVELYK